MNGDASGLEFRGMPQLLVAEPAVGVRQAIERSLVQLWHLHTPVCVQALQPMNSPNFGTWVDVEKRENVLRISPRDDHHSRPAIAYDLLQKERNSRIRVRLVAPDVELRQRSVVIEQQYRVRRLGDSLQKRRELGLHFCPQNALLLSSVFCLLNGSLTAHHATDTLARAFSCTSSGASMRNSHSSVIRFPAQR